MPMPAVTHVTVTATYLDIDSNPLSGYVTFTPSAKLTDAADNVLVMTTPIRVEVNDGALTVSLPVNNDPDLLPNGFTYGVEENFPGIYNAYRIALTSAAAPTVDLTDLVPVASVAAVSLYLRAVDLGTVVETPAGAQAKASAVQAASAQRAANLSDLSDAAAARTNLALGNAATRIVGTTAGTVAAGDDSRFGIEALPVTSGLSWTGAVDLTVLAAAVRTIKATLTGNVTFTLPTPPADVSYTVTLLLTQDATGGRTLTLPVPVLSAYGVDPVLSTAGGATDVLHLMWTGAAWIALLAAPAVS